MVHQLHQLDWVEGWLTVSVAFAHNFVHLMVLKLEGINLLELLQLVLVLHLLLDCSVLHVGSYQTGLVQQLFLLLVKSLLLEVRN